MSRDLENSQALVVAGMHRSGTSMLAAFLERAGLFVGSELLSADTYNKKGYYENVQFKNLHMKALKELAQNEDGWTLSSFARLPEPLEAEADRVIEQNSRAAQATWGWKDPRTCLFLKYWAQKLPQSNYVFIFRPPWEVADSLYRRGDSTFANYPELAFQIWHKYNTEIVEFARLFPQRTLIVSIDEVVTSPQELIAEINHRFHSSLQAVSPDFDDSMLVKGSQHYQRFAYERFANVYGLWQHLESLSWRGGKVDPARLQQIEEPSVEAQCKDWSTARRLTKECKQLQTENSKLTGQLTEAQARLAELETKMEMIGNSRIWRVRNQCATLIGRPPV
jgi:hypothetical protein